MKQYNKKPTRMPHFGAYKKYVSACMAAAIAMLSIRACDEYIIGSKPIVQEDTEVITTTTITTTTAVHTSTTTTTTTSITTTSTTELSIVTSFISEYVDTTEIMARSVEEYEEPESEPETEAVTEYEEPYEEVYEEPEQSGMYCIGSCYVTGYVATGYQTASGEWPYVGGCAMSSAYPLGTRIYVEGLGEYVVNDRGGDGIESGVIDIFCASTEDAYALTGYYTVYVLEE